MQVTRVASPTDIPTYQPNQAAVNAAKAKAVAMLTQSSEQSPAPSNHPAQLNQNSISAEELGAVKQQSLGQPDVSEEVVSSEETEVTPKATPKVEQDPALSRQFAQLARQEKALRAKVQQQEQAIRAREEALKAREEAISAKDQQYSQGYIQRDTLKQDPLSVLAEAGISYDELTQQILNQQPIDPRVNSTINQLKQQIQELKAANEESRKSSADQQTQAYQAAVKQIELDVRSLVANDPNFETIKSTRSTKDVVELITKTYDKDGYVMSVEEAAQQVEDYLVEEAMKLTRIGKIKQRLAAGAQAAPKSQTQRTQETQTQPGMKTLTNNTSTSRKLSAKERAILAFRNELK